MSAVTILDSSLAEILTKARVLTAHKATSGAVAAVTTNWRPSQRERRETASKTPPLGRERVSKTPPPWSGGFRGKFFECGGGGGGGNIAWSRPQEPYSVIPVGGKDILLCTVVRGRGRETSGGNCCISSYPSPRVKVHTALPVIEVLVGGERCGHWSIRGA